MTKSLTRAQAGVRTEKRQFKGLKGLAKHLEVSVGGLLEGMSLHCLENKPSFSKATLEKIEQLKAVYDLDLVAADSHKLQEKGSG